MTDVATTSPTDFDAKPPRRAFSALALVGLIAVLAVGGWAGYAAFSKSAPMAVGADFRPDLPPRGGGFRRAMNAAPAPPPQAVVVAPGAQAVMVRAAGLQLTATLRPDGAWRLSFVHRGGGPTPDAQAMSLVTAYRRKVVEARKPPAELKLTDAQKSALAAVPSSPPELSQAAADRAVELCKELVKLPATDAKAGPMKKELEDLITAAGKGDRGAIVAAYAERAGKLRSILSADQVKTLLDTNPPRAATRPA